MLLWNIIKEEKKGPRTDAPDKAVQGFCTANSVSKLDNILRKRSVTYDKTK